MLVLTRKPQEEICIGNGITITIVRVKGQSVRVGIKAPQDVRIVRKELSLEPDASSVQGNGKAALTERRNDETLEDRQTSIRLAPTDTSPSRTNTESGSEMSPPVCPARRVRSGTRRSTLKSLVARNRAAAGATRVAATTSCDSQPAR